MLFLPTGLPHESTLGGAAAVRAPSVCGGALAGTGPLSVLPWPWKLSSLLLWLPQQLPIVEECAEGEAGRVGEWKEWIRSC